MIHFKRTTRSLKQKSVACNRKMILFSFFCVYKLFMIKKSYFILYKDIKYDIINIY